MRIGETGRAPADKDRDRELTVGRRRRARQDAEDQEQERAKADDPLLARDLEELVVRVSRLMALPPANAFHIGPIAVLEAAGAHAEYRVVADHADGIAPHHAAYAERRSFRRLVEGRDFVEGLLYPIAGEGA